MILDLANPVANVVKTVLAGAIISEDDALGSSVVGLSDGPESLLASCVPDLNFNCLYVQIYVPDFEVNPCFNSRE